MSTALKLDDYDLKILDILQRDGRISKVKLAEAIHLSASPAWERVRRLEKAGVIRGYSAELDAKRITGLTCVMVEITLAQHQGQDFQRFEQAIQALPDVVECQAVGGGVDYVMKVLAADVDSYQRLMDYLLEAQIGIDKYYSYIVTKTVKQGGVLPLNDLLQA